MASGMRRSFSFLFFFFFCAFTFHVNGQSTAQLPEGSINLDCGLDAGYITTITYSDGCPQISYIPDDNFVENGKKEGFDISQLYNSFNKKLMSTKRMFPNGTRGCYTFPVTKGSSILLRAYFYFESQDYNTQFDVYLGVNHWKTITSSTSYVEIIHFPTSKYLHLCLVNTGHGDPFVNYIELRPIGNGTTPNIYNTTGLGSLEHCYSYAGSYFIDMDDTTEIFRFPNDAFDRQWAWIYMNTLWYEVKYTEEELSASNDNYDPPLEALQSTIIPNNNGTNIIIPFKDDQITTNLYVVLHFAELEEDVKRYMYVQACSSLACDARKSLVPPEYLKASAYHFIFQGGGTLTISTNEPKTPPILNALEQYKIIPFQFTETDDDDVDAIHAIKHEYNDTFAAKNLQWIGDPCLPENQRWRGITCTTNNGNGSPRITALNLSSLGLSGGIPQALANLTMLEKLDLSFNNLSGTIPDFLSSLQNLIFISLEGNNMTGPWPSGLLHKSITLKGLFQNQSHSNGRVNVGIIIAIAVAIVVALICISFAIFLVVKFRSKQSKQQESTILPPQAERQFAITPKLMPLTVSEVNNLIHDKIVLGRGGFGTVYLSSMDGNYVAVKILDDCNERQARDFKFEVEILATVHHKNLVRILGYCDHKEKRALVMEYVDNNTLKHHLSAKNADGVLSWDTRVNIIIGAAQGLEYLHHACKPPITHRDIKPENILLTKDFEAKLADFGFSRLLTSQYNTSRLVGTHGYLDTMCLESLDKADIYSFGIVLLVVVTGKLPILPGHVELSHWAKEHIDRGNIHGIIDPQLDGKYDENMAWTIVEIAMKCISVPHSKRPTMEYVVNDLKSSMASTGKTSKSRSLSISESSDIHGPKSR